MSTDFKALCAELAEALDTWLMAHHHGGVPPQDGADAELVLRTRAALAQPEPEGGATGHISCSAEDDCYALMDEDQPTSEENLRR